MEKFNSTVLLKVARPDKSNAALYLNAMFLLMLLAVGFVTPWSIVMAYFLETIIIGILNALKMALCVAYKRHNGGTQGFGIILFFLVHYGFFVAIQSIFAFTFFELGGSTFFTDGISVLKNYWTLLQLDGMWLLLLSIIFNNCFSFITDFLGEKRYLKFTASELMIKPYLRIFIQQFVVVLSGFFLAYLDAGFIAAVLLIVIRRAIDLFLVSLRDNSASIDKMADWYASKNVEVSAEEVKKQLKIFTE